MEITRKVFVLYPKESGNSLSCSCNSICMYAVSMSAVIAILFIHSAVIHVCPLTSLYHNITSHSGFYWISWLSLMHHRLHGSLYSISKCPQHHDEGDNAIWIICHIVHPSPPFLVFHLMMSSYFWRSWGLLSNCQSVFTVGLKPFAD